MSPSSSKALIVSGEITLFDVPFLLESRFQDQDGERVVRFTVRVGDKTLGEVLRYIVGMVNGPPVRLDAPWDVIDRIRLDQFAFEIELGSGQTKYGFSYSDIGLDLTFLQIEKLEIFYVRSEGERRNSSVDVNVYGTFLGIDFTKEPISWDALKERPPSTPGAGEKVFHLEYLGLGQRVTVRDVKSLKTIGAVMKALRESYEPLPDGATNPLGYLPSLTYDDDAAWLVGAQFSVLETFDFAGLWNLPQLAGARIGLRGTRAKSLAGFEFEILYRRVADDLGQYHFELVLPDVLRRFQAGVASVTLPIISIDVYTDGGFLVDLGFPRDLDFTRSFSIEMLILGVPVTGALGVYFGVLSEKAVPAIPAITGGSFKPVIVAGAGFRIGVGKSITAGILNAGLFVGIESLIEGILGFYEPLEDSEPSGTFFRLAGTLQLTGHIWGDVSFAIVKAKVDVYAYVAAHASFEAYRATLVVFSAGVSLQLTVSVGFGFLSFKVKLSFGATITAEIPIGQDTATPWRLDSETGTTLAERLGPVAYRRLPTGDVIADAHFAALLERAVPLAHRSVQRRPEAERVPLVLHFHPVTTVGIAGDAPGGTETDEGTVRLAAVLMARLSRGEDEPLAPAEAFVNAALDWGLAQVRHQIRALGAVPDEDTVTLSELRFLYDDLVDADPRFPIDLAALEEFFDEYVTAELVPADGLTAETAVTPFPMIPFLRLETSTGYAANFETEPMCSPEYQAFITRYFEELDQGPRRGAGSAVRAAEVETLSMAGLIFVDSFRIVLRSVVSAAIDGLRLLHEPAAGAGLREIARRTGLDNPAGMRRLAQANADNPAYFAAESPVRIVARGVPLAEAGGLDGLAYRFDLTRLVTARHLRTQPVLRTGAALRVTGGHYRLQPGDTKDSILHRFGIPDWAEVEAANPFFDWQVPPAVKDGPYPTLEVPAGERIRLPSIAHPLAEGETLHDIAAFYDAPLFTLVADANDVPLADDGLGYRCVSLFTLEGETLTRLAGRAGLPELQPLTPAVADAAGLLPAGASLAVPRGRHVFGRGDTLQALASRLQTTPDAIVAANTGEDPALDWKFVPRPGENAALPLGVEIVLPEVPAFRVAGGETFASIAARFGLSADQLITGNAEVSLAPLIEVILPPLTVIQGEAPQSAEALARPFAVSPADLVLANPGAAAGQGSDIRLGTVRVPDCEKIARDRLTALLAEGGTDSSLARTASSMARFLLAGLRLPAPDAAGRVIRADTAPRAEESLYPLYTLTGQQWDAPAQPTEADWVQLSWNESEQAKRFIAATHRGGPAAQPLDVRVHLGALDLQLITAFREALGDPAGLQPALLALSPYPALEQVAVQQPLGTPTEWARPTPLTFKAAAADEDRGEVEIHLHAVSRGLRETLPAVPDPLRRLEVRETLYDPATGQALVHALTNVGWATRLDFQIQRLRAPDEAPDEDHVPLPAAYELLSAGAQTQADLLGLRSYLELHGEEMAVDLSILYPAGALSSVPDTLRSDEITDRNRVALLKSNLSTVSHPPISLAALRDPGAVLASATLEEPRAFLELLWQVSVTNAGGFYLDYAIPADDPGLPDAVFGEGETATISVLALLRPDAARPGTIDGRRFHNVVVSAENLASPESTLNVAARRHTVIQTDPEKPAITETLDAIAAHYGLDAGVLGLLNASTPNLINVGAVIRKPGDEPEPPTYEVRAGDDLLTVAGVFGVTVEALAGSIGSRNDLLHAGATMEVYSEWVAARNRVEPDLGGFRVLRKVPAEVPAGPDDLGARARIERLFNLMGYGLRETEHFAASTRGLPIPPADPDERARNGRFAMSAGEAQPWVYARLLPIARWAKDDPVPKIEAPDPYAGLGRAAPVAIDFHDVFGNRLPRPGEAVTIDWHQRYRDALIPVHAWPSVTLAYDVVQLDTHHAPVVATRIKFAPAGYVGTPGTPYALMRERFAADRARFSRAYYQVADQRVRATLTTTLRSGYEEVLSTERLAQFAGDAFAWLGALGWLEPVRHEVREGETLEGIARIYRLTVPELAAHIAADPGALATDEEIDIPRSVTVLPNASIDDILALLDDANVTAADLGRWNAGIPLTARLNLLVGETVVETAPGDTLQRLATGNADAARIAADNAGVKALFLAGEELDLGTARIAIGQGDTLASLAHAHGLRLERLADANRTDPILREGAALEIPAHLAIPEGTPCSAEVRKNESIDTLVQRLGASVRDLLTANTNTPELLVPGQAMRYPEDGRGGNGEVVTETVLEHDTLYTITRRFAAAVGDPSLKPADVGAYPSNAENRKLLRSKARVLRPPVRVLVDLSVPKDATRDITIVPLETVLHLRRTDSAEIDPAFAASPEVAHVSSVVPPRLSSDFSPDDRATLRAFTQQFQSVFDNLRLASGADTVASAAARMAGESDEAAQSKLVAVQWDRNVLEASVHGPACFFAPRPLLRRLWHGTVDIYPYVPGQPLDGGQPTPTNYTGVDLERWAQDLLRRIDRLLLPDMALSLRVLDPARFQALIDAKRDLADAIVARVGLVLPAESGPDVPVPDVASAREQLLQQLLVELSETYRGGIVVQYEAKVTAPDGPEWTPRTAPRLVCALAPALVRISGDRATATLDELAARFSATPLLIAELLQNTENILDVGKTVPVGTKPEIKPQDTIASIADEAGVTLAGLVQAVKSKPGFLAPGAGVPVSARSRVADADDTFGSVLEHLAPNLTARGLLERAVAILDVLNGATPGVFVPGVMLKRTVDDKVLSHETTVEDTIRSVAKALSATVFELVDELYVTAPLIAPGAGFRYLALYPPSTISASKIALYSGGDPRSKLNAVYLTTAPDEASSVSLKLGYAVQAMEYNVRDVSAIRGAMDYQASDWLTFIDWEHGEDLGEVQIPIPNRRFPVPPAILSHDTVPKAVDGKIDPDRLDEIPRYDYVLSFAFDASAQDQLFYTRRFNVAAAAPGTSDGPETALAASLAQFAAIDVALWEDLELLGAAREAGLAPDDRERVLNAVKVFVGLATRIAADWKTWAPPAPPDESGSRFRIRRHRHPDGRTTVTVAGGDSAAAPVACALPSARLLGRPFRGLRHGAVHVTDHAVSAPVPRTRRGEKYEVCDPDLTVLAQQNCWGLISVTRNESLVQGSPTEKDFVLEIRDVQAIQPATPAITITQRLDVARGLKPLADRMAELLRTLLFPGPTPPRARQLASVTAAFARRLVEDRTGLDDATAQPADASTLFAPVVTTPSLPIEMGAEAPVDPQKVAAELAGYLDDWLQQRRLAPLDDDWALTLRLFSEIEGDDTGALLLEILDLRVRMVNRR